MKLLVAFIKNVKIFPYAEIITSQRRSSFSSSYYLVFVFYVMSFNSVYLLVSHDVVTIVLVIYLFIWFVFDIKLKNVAYSSYLCYGEILKFKLKHF